MSREILRLFKALLVFLALATAFSSVSLLIGGATNVDVTHSEGAIEVVSTDGGTDISYSEINVTVGPDTEQLNLESDSTIRRQLVIDGESEHQLQFPAETGHYTITALNSQGDAIGSLTVVLSKYTPYHQSGLQMVIAIAFIALAFGIHRVQRWWEKKDE